MNLECMKIDDERTCSDSTDSIEEHVLDMFENATKLIVKDTISEIEFKFCADAIMIAMEFFEEKRCQEWAFR